MDITKPVGNRDLQCGLLGRHLSHSYSPEIHETYASYRYDLFEREPEDVEDFVRNGPWHAINVTIPYKKTVLPFMDELSPIARRLGSVNTIVRRKDGTLFGHNTDYHGFSDLVRRSGLEPKGKKCLVLGNGGASVTAVAVLSDMGGEVVVISRTGENNYQNLHLHSDAAMICNCTPVGMYPEPGVSPVDLAMFPHLEGVLDMIYNPAKTNLLMDAEDRGLIAVNGLWMLVAQATEASRFFVGADIPEEWTLDAYRAIRARKENIVLIGMPGCGKSYSAKKLHDVFPSRPVVEIDEEIEKAAGKTIPEIFAQDGEEAFRTLETEILQKFGMKSGLIISTGGGCVTRQRNYRPLHQNGQIFWIQRDICLLPTEGRPLSQAGKLSDMYRVREPMYRSFADHIVESGSGIDEITQIMRKLP